MANHKIYVFISVLFVVAGITSCKKKSSNNLVTGEKIATIDYTRGGLIQHYAFFYDSYNNVDSEAIIGAGTAAGNNGYNTFSYFGSSFSITDEYNNTTLVQANTAGMILKVFVPDTLIMTYTNSLLAELDSKSATLTPPYYITSSVYYTWVSGDLTFKGPTTGTSYTYYYDASQSGQAGDPMRVDDLISYGRPYIKTVHLPKGIISGGDTVEHYNYQFDALGRISLLQRYYNYPGVTDSATYSYQYY